MISLSNIIMMFTWNDITPWHDDVHNMMMVFIPWWCTYNDIIHPMFTQKHVVLINDIFMFSNDIIVFTFHNILMMFIPMKLSSPQNMISAPRQNDDEIMIDVHLTTMKLINDIMYIQKHNVHLMTYTDEVQPISWKNVCTMSYCSSNDIILSTYWWWPHDILMFYPWRKFPFMIYWHVHPMMFAPSNENLVHP